MLVVHIPHCVRRLIRFAGLFALALGCCPRATGSEPAPSFQWINKHEPSHGGLAAVRSVALDGDSAPFVAGYFVGTITLGTNTLTSSSTNSWPYDLFVTRCDGAGRYLWVRQVGGGGVRGELTLLAADTNQNAIACGLFYGSASFGTTNLTNSPHSEPCLFLAKFDPLGQVLWATTAGRFYPQSIFEDHLTPIALDQSGNIYLTG
jgi:hypothetical protein